MTEKNELEKKQSGDLMTDPIDLLIKESDMIDRAMQSILKDGTHFGVLPGTSKKMLYKAGAEVIGRMFKLTARYKTEIERHEKNHITYTIYCELFSSSVESIGEGLGICSTLESKYRYRTAKKVCPACGFDLNIDKKSNGFYCWQKMGGCGAVYESNDQRISSQIVGKIEYEDVADYYNTCIKMAKKRSYVDAIITRTACSHKFTQDEDSPALKDKLDKGTKSPPPVTKNRTQNKQPPPGDPSKDFDQMRNALNEIKSDADVFPHYKKWASHCDNNNYDEKVRQEGLDYIENQIYDRIKIFVNIPENDHDGYAEYINNSQGNKEYALPKVLMDNIQVILSKVNKKTDPVNAGSDQTVGLKLDTENGEKKNENNK